MTWLMAPAALPSWQLLLAVSGVHVTVTDDVSVQPASPSLTVSVSVAVPAAVHVKRVDEAAASVMAPEVVVQAYDSGEGPASTSCAAPTSAIDAPTNTS